MRPGDWLAVHGCGGVGLSAVMIAASMGLNVIAVDIDDATLARASGIGAVATINAAHSSDVPDEIIHLTGGGAHASRSKSANVARYILSSMTSRARS